MMGMLDDSFGYDYVVYVQYGLLINTSTEN